MYYIVMVADDTALQLFTKKIQKYIPLSLYLHMYVVCNIYIYIYIYIIALK